jgi:hypothetical protein
MNQREVSRHDPAGQPRVNGYETSALGDKAAAAGVFREALPFARKACGTGISSHVTGRERRF